MKAQINLFQPEVLDESVRRPVSLQKLFLPVLIFFILFLFAGFYIQDGKKQILLMKEIEEMQQQRDQLRRQIETLAAVSPSVEQVKKFLGDPMSDDPSLKERIIWSRLLQEVSWVVPEEVWITELENGTDHAVRFAGFTVSNQNVTRLMASLERSRYFQDVLLEFSRQNAGERKIDFSIHARLKKEAFHDLGGTK